MTNPRVSIIFRALNEEKWFDHALSACAEQRFPDDEIEVILVDSGSTDQTIAIAERHGCAIVHIKKSDFTFGRSLNYGCAAATGEFLVFISAHCIPANPDWLARLIAPLRTGAVDYVYGRQIGNEKSRFSERQIFAQYFPAADMIPQDGFFINNANAAIRKDAWAKYEFDEAVTGLEDMVLGKAIVNDGGKIGYVADATVTHIHEESFRQTRRRYYREALTLREIMPQVHFRFGDFLRYFFAGVFHDFSVALGEKTFWSTAPEIVAFRLMQFWGAYRGHNEHRTLSREDKERYYYPSARRRPATDGKANAPAADASGSSAEKDVMKAQP